VIPALVLTAGLATRLRPLSLVRAKAALPVAGHPLITRILRSLRSADVTDAVLNLHHLPPTLTRIVGDGSDLGVRVRYSWENPVLGSAGGPRQALPLLNASTFLIVNGDTLADVDITALVAAHKQSGALVTMAAAANANPEKYGGIIASADGIVTGFAKRGSAQPSYHFVGVQVAEAEAFAALKRGNPYESVGAVYPALMSQRPGAVRAHVCAAEFFDIGTPDDYLRTSLLLSNREGTGVALGPGTRVDTNARIEDSILWDDVQVGKGSLLKQCIVTDGAHVPEDTSWIGVMLRRADGDLAPGERRIGDLAIASI
jgi:NDP-sugar pyrophosphorylase family protein